MCMSAYVIWTDVREGKVFKMTPKGPEMKHFHAHGPKHPHEPQGKHQEKHHPESESLFKDMASAIGDATEILVVGPADAKIHFRHFLEEHHGDLARKIVAIETMDHNVTDNQVLAAARKFFKTYDLYK